METRSSSTEMILIGGSAGSLQVILEMLKKLRSLPAPMVLILHRKAQSISILPKLLQQYSALEVIEVEDKTEIEDKKIYVVPSDYHLLFENKTTASLDSSEKMNYSRPSIDVTFKSGAEMYGESVVGILLSGANADGVEGLNYIKKNNGRVWIQDPETAVVDYMPRKAKEQVPFDLIFSGDALAAEIDKL